ncbi:hypothetical protein N9C10_01370 [Flavobacteriaceae bacterium]|nr:hypothetical protein [Flavobacteriaceae bacterium]
MPKAPPCSQYEPPAHSLVTRKTGSTYCRKKPVRKAKAPAAASSPPKSPAGVEKIFTAKKVRKTRSNKGTKRAPARGGLGAMVKKHPANKPAAKKKANDPNKGKFLVAIKFKVSETRNARNLNNVNFRGNPLYSAANKAAIKAAKAPTNKEFSNYMGNQNRYRTYLENLYAYANYGRIPNVRNYKNGTVRYVLDPSVKNFNNKVMFPTAKSIKNNLTRHRTGLANGTWASAPGGHGVYPLKLTNGSLDEFGVINYNTVSVKKL